MKKLLTWMLAAVMCLSLVGSVWGSEEADPETEINADTTIEGEVDDLAEPEETSPEELPEDADSPEAEEGAEVVSEEPAEELPSEPKDEEPTWGTGEAPAVDGEPTSPVKYNYPLPGAAAKRLVSVTAAGNYDYTTSFTYNAAGQISLHDSYTYTYDNAGRLTQKLGKEAKYVVAYPYTYDTSGRLTSEKQLGEGGLIYYEHKKYTYDSDGYLATASRSSTRSYNETVAWEKIQPVSFTHWYNENGHLIYTGEYGDDEYRADVYEYDAAGRLIANDFYWYDSYFDKTYISPDRWLNFIDTPCFSICDHLVETEGGVYLDSGCIFYDTAGNIVSTVWLGETLAFDHSEHWLSPEEAESLNNLKSPLKTTFDADGYLISASYTDDWGRKTTYTFTYEDNPLYEAPPVSTEQTVTYGGYSTQFGPDELQINSIEGINNKNMAVLCAMLSDAAYNDASTLENVYRQMFNGSKWDCQLDYDSPVFRSGIALGTVQIGSKEANVLVITIKGTQITDGDWSEVFADADFTTTELWGYATYKAVADFEKLVMTRLNDFLVGHPEITEKPLKVIITGHSLGGAAANLLAMRFTKFTNSGAWWSQLVDKSGIYAYTFGAIDALNIDYGARGADKVVYPVFFGYENIHNVYNLYDTFSPLVLGNFIPGGTVVGKYGHMDLFVKDYCNGPFDAFANHMMSSYLHAVSGAYVGEGKSNYYRIWYKCPVDIEVYEGNTLVGRIRNNEIDTSVTSVDMFVSGDEKGVILPTEKQYTFRITATDDGKMEYSVERYADSAGDMTVFENVALTPGKEMTSTVGGNIQTEDVALYVVDDTGKPVAEVNEDGSETLLQNETGGYILDLSGASVKGSDVSGTGKLLKSDGSAPDGKKYVYIVVNYERSDSTTWAVAGTYTVDADGVFDLPTITGVADRITRVIVVGLDAKVGANWAGHNVARPAFI